MDNINKLIELSDRQSLFENKTQPGDKGAILSAITEIHSLRRKSSSDEMVISKLQNMLSRTEGAYALCQAEIKRLDADNHRLTVRLQTWHEAQNMTKAQAEEYLSRPDNKH